MSTKNKDTDFFSQVLKYLRVIEDDRESIAEASNMAALTPMVLTGGDLVNTLDTETIHNIYQFNLSMYAAMWIRAASLLLPVDGNFEDATVEKILEPLSDRRPRTTTDSAVKKLGEFIADLTLEGYNSELNLASSSGSLLEQFDAEKYEEAEVAKPSNLAVGKLIYLPINIKGQSKALMQPIQVTVKPNVIDVNFMARLLNAFVGKDQSIMGRWRRFIDGEIEGSATYLLGFDIIAEDRKLRMEDKDGLYGLIQNNRSRGTLSSIMAGKKLNYNVASNMMVMSTASMRQLEGAMRGKMSSPRTRDRFFKTTGCMMLSVVDPTMEKLVVYTLGQSDYGVYSFDDLKFKGNNSGANDIQGMLKSFELGKSFNM
ncbi:hypothetical protein SM033_00240 [Vibrio phage vB_VpaM_sm033]|nr:hypothetical protein SM033_00240 [Vibrio phage vB_VpaM_sm033]